MRKVIYSVAASLDGYIAGPEGQFDWIPMDPEIDWAGFMSRFDTVLMGRHSYMVAASGEGGASLPDMPCYVFSRTLAAEDHPNVTIVADDADRVIKDLREAPGKDIWLYGGGNLAGSLLEAGLVDIVEIALVPILLGRGLPMLPPIDCRTRLALTKTERYASSGIVLLSYDVIRS
ncbi:MAG: dihydrofolate reductase [Planctomycetes bacterium]|nr:dihydrofolate reductase [Planctomycetota bacterium]